MHKAPMVLLLLAISLQCAAQSSWYKVFKGDVNGQPVVMNLHKAGSKLSGHLWYTAMPQPIKLWQDMTKKNDSLCLATDMQNGESMRINGIMHANKFTGIAQREKEEKLSDAGRFSLQDVSGSFSSMAYVYTQGGAALPLKMKDPPACSYYSATVWPQKLSNKKLETALRKEINLWMGNEGLPTEPGKWFLKEKQSTIASWKKEHAGATLKEVKEFPSAYAQETEEDIQVAYEDDKLITLVQSTYDYSGGAHGNYGYTVSSFHKLKATRIALKDVLTNAGIKALPPLLEQAIRNQLSWNNQESLQANGLFSNKIEDNDNFYLTAGGIGFIYNPYEIAPYALGAINLFIPKSSIEAYLKPAFK